MRLLVMGADSLLGSAAVDVFSEDHTVTAAAWRRGRSSGRFAEGITLVEFEEYVQIAKVVERIDAIIYLPECARPANERPDSEIITQATLAPFRLLRAARDAGVERIVLASTLQLFDAYPREYRIDEQWRPRPQPEAADLAPLLLEQTCREFAREGPMTVTALRFDPAEIDNDPNIAISAIEKALSTPKQVPGYRWQVFHIAVSDRYITRHARNYLGGSKREATGE